MLIYLFRFLTSEKNEREEIELDTKDPEEIARGQGLG